MSIPYIRSRLISFKVTGMRPNSQVFGFFDGINISAFMNTTAGTGASVRVGSLPRGSAYLEVDNIYSEATTYPADLGAVTTKMVTDGNGAISGYFLLPRTSAFKFKTGNRVFTLLDISTFNPHNATTIAEFIYEASGILRDVDQDILETRVVQYSSLSNQLADIAVGSYTDNDNDGGSTWPTKSDGGVIKVPHPHKRPPKNNDWTANDMMTNAPPDTGIGGRGPSGPQ